MFGGFGSDRSAPARIRIHRSDIDDTSQLEELLEGNKHQVKIVHRLNYDVVIREELL